MVAQLVGALFIANSANDRLLVLRTLLFFRCGSPSFHIPPSSSLNYYIHPMRSTTPLLIVLLVAAVHAAFALPTPRYSYISSDGSDGLQIDSRSLSAEKHAELAEAAETFHENHPNFYLTSQQKMKFKEAIEHHITNEKAKLKAAYMRFKERHRTSTPSDDGLQLRSPETLDTLSDLLSSSHHCHRSDLRDLDPHVEQIAKLMVLPGGEGESSKNGDLEAVHLWALIGDAFRMIFLRPSTPITCLMIHARTCMLTLFRSLHIKLPCSLADYALSKAFILYMGYLVRSCILLQSSPILKFSSQSARLTFVISDNYLRLSKRRNPRYPGRRLREGCGIHYFHSHACGTWSARRSLFDDFVRLSYLTKILVFYIQVKQISFRNYFRCNRHEHANQGRSINSLMTTQSTTEDKDTISSMTLSKRRKWFNSKTIRGESDSLPARSTPPP
ncbi:hypothetical protein ABKN59_011324 [Abortiporus biennis]